MIMSGDAFGAKNEMLINAEMEGQPRGKRLFECLPVTI